MNEQIKDLLEQIDEGLNNLERRTSFPELKHKERLFELKTNLANFKHSENPDYLKGAINFFHETAGLYPEGSDLYKSSIWDTNVQVRGKRTTLEELFSKLEKLYKDLYR